MGTTRFAALWLCPLLLGGPMTSAEERTGSARARFAKSTTEAVPDFQKHVVPLLGRMGCNASKCHGSFQGKGGFRLSLFGYDFANDLKALHGKATDEGTRIDSHSPGDSLIILKPSRQVPHRGGQRFKEGSWEHHLLLQWIASGANGIQKPHTLKRLEVSPPEILFQAKGEKAALKVIAIWSNGTKEDVTCLCRFRTNDDAIATVDANGNVVSVGRGDSHIVAFYDNGVAAIPVLRPFGKSRLGKGKDYTNPIDRFVEAKLQKLGIEPSDLSTDAEFLRRVSIDLTGTLPTPEEVTAFLANPRKDKRSKKIDELLGRATYAAWWANKLCDFTGCSPTAQTGVLEVGQAMAAQWYDWIYRRIARNTPYDQLVNGIVLSVSRKKDQSAAAYNEEMSSYVRRASPADFSRRETMPHYWTRQSVKEPKEKAMAFAHSFLGIQLQCAQCHKHPFDQWTQKDFTDFTAFFDRIQSRGRVGFPQFAAAQAGQTINWPQLLIQPGQKRSLRLLRSHTVTVGSQEDPRQPIMEWLRDKDNPWFARAFVNRVWASYFHQGIVDPPDAFTPANPPSNPDLLQWLTQQFIDRGYDMKWLHRQITTSETYQRSWKPNKTNREDRRNFSRAIPRRIPAEVVYDALKQITASKANLDSVRNNLKRRASGHLSMRMAGTYAMNVFGKPERALNCDCERVNEPTLLQSIFLQNDPLVRMRLAESGWIDDIKQSLKNGNQPDRRPLVRAVWLRTVNRPPSKQEMNRALKHLSETRTVNEAMTDLLWALLNTREFLLNH